MEEKRQTRQYTREYKAEAVKLARDIGVSKAAVELGVPTGTLAGWQSEANKGRLDTGAGTQTPSSGLTQAARIQELEAEIKRISKENRRLNELNEFLEEASAFFAASRQKSKQKSGSNSSR